MNQSLSYFRIGFAISLLLIEVMVLSLLVDASTIPKHGLISMLLAEAGNVLRWLIVSAGILVLLLSKGFKYRLKTLLGQHTIGASLLAFGIHLGFFLSFAFITLLVFRVDVTTADYYSYLWLILVGLTGVSWCFIIASINNWKTFLSKERMSIAGAVVSGLLVVALGFYFQRFWGSMTEFTLESTKFLLEFFYHDIIFDPSHRNLGVNDFWVNIAPVCSGIEGAVLAVSIAAIYLYLSRQYLKFPQALILLPLAGIVSIILNIVRLAALISLGAEVSPALAIGGFHSVAGWIAAILVALLIVFIFSHWKWIQKDQRNDDEVANNFADSWLAQAILIPFVIFTASTLIGGIFVDEFDYYYPVKVILSFAAILYFWKIYNLQKPDRKFEAITVGALVALLWIFMIPADEQINANISNALSAMPFWALIGWSIFRLIGFWILAPILEELVFREYLLSRLSGQEISSIRKPAFSLLALIVSSVLFGLLHSAWLAGIVAGLLFALVRYRSTHITSCILSHSTANILVAAWVLYSGNWSLI